MTEVSFVKSSLHSGVGTRPTPPWRPTKQSNRDTVWMTSAVTPRDSRMSENGCCHQVRNASAFLLYTSTSVCVNSLPLWLSFHLCSGQRNKIFFLWSRVTANFDPSSFSHFFDFLQPRVTRWSTSLVKRNLKLHEPLGLTGKMVVQCRMSSFKIRYRMLWMAREIEDSV